MVFIKYCLFNIIMLYVYIIILVQFVHIACAPNCNHCLANNKCLPLECNDGFVFNAASQTCDGKDDLCLFILHVLQFA